MYGLDVITAWAKRKGFVYPGSQIYGGLANAWDYGPYGSQLKKNIADARWQFFVTERDDMIGMDTAIIAHPRTWDASGHTENFGDFLIDDKKTGQRFRPDKLIEDYIEIFKNLISHSQHMIRGNIEINTIKDMGVNEISIDAITKLKKTNANYESIYNLFVVFFNKNKGNSQRDLNEKDIIDSINFDSSLGIDNLIPEARGSDKMKKFLDKYIIKNPDTKQEAERTDIRKFNLMLYTYLGPVHNEDNKVWMRPETCQSLFTNFKNICDSTRLRVPFGMAQIGKAFRNEITPGQFLYRTREFEQMEIEYFLPTDSNNPDPVARKEENRAISKPFFDAWKEASMTFWKEIIKLKPENVKFREHEADELSHYSQGTFDVEYNYPWGWGELQGIANRGDWDLSRHQEYSQQDMQYKDPKTGARYIPWVIEPSFGLSRTVMAVMMDCYDEEKLEKDDGSVDTRIVIRFPFNLAPVKYAVLPLVEKDENMVRIGKDLAKTLKKAGYHTDYDASGGIGKRYRRQDEIGTPYCICIDHQTLEDNTVTIRDRDTMKHVGGEGNRISLDQIVNMTVK